MGLTVSAAEALKFAGLLQCLLILVLILRSRGRAVQTWAPVAFFAVLGVAFGMPQRGEILDLPAASDGLRLVEWLAWAFVPVLSYLMILQMAAEERLRAAHFLVLALPPLGPLSGLVWAWQSGVCGGPLMCADVHEWIGAYGAVAGAAVLLVLWLQRGVIPDIRTRPGGRQRYWLALSLVIVVAATIALELARGIGSLGLAELQFVRNLLGLTFVYLAATLLFRVEAAPARRRAESGKSAGLGLSVEERTLALRIGNLMRYDKLYQEATFSRADLARELQASESIVSRAINRAFGKNFRQLLNEFRVAEARQLLGDTDWPIGDVGDAVGFNSAASFNRVFREAAGCSPRDYRHCHRGGRFDGPATGDDAVGKTGRADAGIGRPRSAEVGPAQPSAAAPLASISSGRN